jgi:hypothetical protein
MPTDDKMNIEERFKYLRIIHRRYAVADRKERGQLLDEMEATTGLNRKTLVRRMNGNRVRKRRCRQRGQTYGADVDDALRVIDDALDHITAERQTPNLVWMADLLAMHGELVLSPQLRQQLAAISVSTVQRRLKRLHQDEPRLPRPRPKRRNRVARDIPMRRIPWNEPEPGHFEVDLVHHCGPSSSGEYVHTLQMIDVATGWSERVAVLGRSYLVMEDAFGRILARLPFPVREIHPDNGSEFLNHHLLRYFGQKIEGIKLSRSRPWHKNDNRFVEQKNHTLVRAYLGHERLDTVAQTHAVNALYQQMWLYYNLFQPVMRLAEKIVVREQGQSSRLRRRFDLAQTPFDRLCAAGGIRKERREELACLREMVNPRQLKREIYDSLDRIFTLPHATPGVSEDVYQTLGAAALP